MTVVLSIAASDMMITAVDSAVTRDFGDFAGVGARKKII